MDDEALSRCHRRGGLAHGLSRPARPSTATYAPADTGAMIVATGSSVRAIDPGAR
jgi:hypothetical protein